MPFTPFHFGPGAFVKSVIPAYFSFLIFAATQILIDCETLYYILTEQYPLHRLLHTYLGCNLAVITMVFAGRPALNLFVRRKITWPAAATGAFFGAHSHVFLDSLMHRDIKPFAPFSNANPMLGAVNLDVLHLFCVLIFFIGVVTLAIKHAKSQQ